MKGLMGPGGLSIGGSMAKKRKKQMDPGGRLVIAILLRQGKLSKRLKAECVEELLADGLTRKDLKELYPGLLHA